MPTYEDMDHYMHFSDNQDKEDGDLHWESIYKDEKYSATPNVAQHHMVGITVGNIVSNLASESQETFVVQDGTTPESLWEQSQS